MLCGDADINPGPRIISQQGFTVCQWNLNSVFAHNLAKIFLLKADVAIHKLNECVSKYKKLLCTRIYNVKKYIFQSQKEDRNKNNCNNRNEE